MKKDDSIQHLELKSHAVSECPWMRLGQDVLKMDADPVILFLLLEMRCHFTMTLIEKKYHLIPSENT